jgi:lambda repressor-like predicted transcriptional regulator
MGSGSRPTGRFTLTDEPTSLDVVKRAADAVRFAASSHSDSLAAMRGTGASLRDIASMSRYSVETIRAMLGRRPPGDPPGRASPDWVRNSEQALSEAETALEASIVAAQCNGATLRQISECAGLSTATLTRVLARHQVTAHPRGPRRQEARND